MNHPDIAGIEELKEFLAAHPDTQMMEVLMPDINGIPRGKRIPRREFETFFTSGLKSPVSASLMDTSGDISETLFKARYEGDPDRMIFPVAGSLCRIPWLESNTAQVLATFRELSGEICYRDPRNVLQRAMQPLQDMGLKPVVATETEFYLLEDTKGSVPKPLRGRVPGTGIRQPGLQFGMLEDLWDVDGFLETVRSGAVEQGIPVTSVLSEFSGGQFEINLHHVEDALQACDQAIMLKRLIKGSARSNGLGATFMAKPFEGVAGSGLHVHISLYDTDGNNVLADPASDATPPIGDRMRHAVGGLAETMGDSMAIFSPNANSYRRLVLGNFAPVSPNWGYNHRAVALRIPVSGTADTRIEHRVAGADSNPYLVMAALMAGLHHGLSNACDPGEMIMPSQQLPEEKVTLPIRWREAVQTFQRSSVLPRYLGEQYHQIYATVKLDECQEYHERISPLDYEYYLRAV